MPDLTAEGRDALATIAQRHGVSFDAALTLLNAVTAGGGTMAQFSHPELGGMGQWSAGGMVMVGDMFNNALKHRVDVLCSELANFPRAYLAHPAGGGATAHWWGADLGMPAASGGQNDMRYAYFPAIRRLAIQQHGEVRIYDTGDHQIGGVSQQQSGTQSLSFTSQYGAVSVADLPRVDGGKPSPPAPPVQQVPASQPPASPSSAPTHDDPIGHIERLAGLHQRGILSDAEFAAKKAELLQRI